MKDRVGLFEGTFFGVVLKGHQKDKHNFGGPTWTDPLRSCECSPREFSSYETVSIESAHPSSSSRFIPILWRAHLGGKTSSQRCRSFTRESSLISGFGLIEPFCKMLIRSKHKWRYSCGKVMGQNDPPLVTVGHSHVFRLKWLFLRVGSELGFCRLFEGTLFGCVLKT